MPKKTYSVNAKPIDKWDGVEDGLIQFRTNDERIFSAVLDFIEMATDAINYRNIAQKVVFHAIAEDE